MGFFRTKKVTVRKARTCHGCMSKFPINSSMIYVCGADGGDFSDYYLCEPCDDIISKHKDLKEYLQDGFIKGEVRQYCIDNDLPLPGQPMEG